MPLLNQFSALLCFPVGLILIFCTASKTHVPQRLDNYRGVRTMKEYCFKVEIAQLELSDLGREDHPKA